MELHTNKLVGEKQELEDVESFEDETTAIEEISLDGFEDQEAEIVLNKPTIDEVRVYAEVNLGKIIHKRLHYLPEELKDEARQSAFERVVKAYDKIDVTKGWKSFVYRHCVGAIQDFDKRGQGNSESKWSLKKPKPDADGNPQPQKKNSTPKMTERVSFTNFDNESRDIEHGLGSIGIFSELDIESPKINWELVSRLSSVDHQFLVFAKLVRGFTIEEIAESFGVKRGVIVDKLKKFMDRVHQINFDLQIIYSLGLSDRFGARPIDQSIVTDSKIGWENEEIDLDAWDHSDILYSEPLEIESVNQPGLFDK
jgi:hypothetical protein